MPILGYSCDSLDTCHFFYFLMKESLKILHFHSLHRIASFVEFIFAVFGIPLVTALFLLYPILKESLSSHWFPYLFEPLGFQKYHVFSNPNIRSIFFPYNASAWINNWKVSCVDFIGSWHEQSDKINS